MLAGFSSGLGFVVGIRRFAVALLDVAGYTKSVQLGRGLLCGIIGTGTDCGNGWNPRST